ncbi:MAG TPA: hypothetical protein PKY81_16350 [bacterium]|nr:hypothetical protein [bacterium]HPN32525.1 hypothetical protein [bacterium]
MNIKDREIIKNECQKLYIFESKTLAEISKIKSIPVSTLSRWKISNKWEDGKKQYQGSNIEIRKHADAAIIDVLSTIQNTNDINVKTKLFDGLSKVVKTRTAVSKSVDEVSAAYCVMSWFGDYIQETETDTELKRKIQGHILAFLEDREKR